MRKVSLAFTFFVIAIGAAAQQLPAKAATVMPPPVVKTAAPVLPPGPGQKIVASTCGACHGLETVTGAHQSQKDWQATVEDMNDKGAGLNAADLKTVVSYLSANFPPVPKKIVLPDGPGKDLVADACTQCHTLDRVVRQHMDKTGWQGTIEDMEARGLDLSTSDEAAIVAYLTAHYGKSDKQ